jgi:hypothetical protein
MGFIINPIDLYYKGYKNYYLYLMTFPSSPLTDVSVNATSPVPLISYRYAQLLSLYLALTSSLLLSVHITPTPQGT